ncbi:MULTISPECIES: hypothetical protein [unclassified Dysgonomonas]|jgi:hypothetical protein|uniref:DUF7687 domain-containing protein n=1 Tax=unclassified Dysgonomonas TaxID=2630389 RepID=UPI0025C16810|nr:MULTISPECIES: hypothetical protein [unclassified Dysgonomonas]MDR2003971.1 hypothetical protein [Prevotella sp.]HMM04001.1 hypothetical protein [Dysgonomonas sp.]
MIPNPKFKNLDLEFWANVKLLNQKLGYTIRKTKNNPKSGFVIPSVRDIIFTFREENLSYERLVKDHMQLTELGELLIQYMQYRGYVLEQYVRPNLMNKDQAKALFEKIKGELNSRCPLPYNKQKGDKKDFSFLTGLVNMLIESNIGDQRCDYDPRELTSLTIDGYPVRTLSRRVDGAFPSTKDPIAIWEIKEYYYTTTFGSRVADGVYETQLDGWELWEAYTNLGRQIKHYLIIDDYYTWWDCGKSYLCRLIDSMHMGLVSEVLFGREVIDRIPVIVEEWKSINKKGSL